MRGDHRGGARRSRWPGSTAPISGSAGLIIGRRCSSSGRRSSRVAAPPPPEEIARRGYRRSSRCDLLALGVARRLAIFLYVGAEVAIGTQMAFFLNSDASAAFRSRKRARRSPLLGRRDGRPADRIRAAGAGPGAEAAGGLHRRRPADVPLCLRRRRRQRGLCRARIGLFNSIMFPVIFTLTLERSTARRKRRRASCASRSSAAR